MMGITRTSPTDELTTEPMRRRHLRRVLDIEELVHKRPWTHRVFVDELSQVRSGSRSYIVAYVGDTLVGYAGLFYSAGDAHVTNIATHPTWQGRGIATELMLDLCDLAVSNECTAMTLEVRASNDIAQRLYRRFGFVPAGVRKKYYENSEDAIVMWCHDLQGPDVASRLAHIKESRR
jgi:ribosomal-protein-alanine N-acetyltransferase